MYKVTIILKSGKKITFKSRSFTVTGLNGYNVPETNLPCTMKWELPKGFMKIDFYEVVFVKSVKLKWYNIWF